MEELKHEFIIDGERWFTMADMELVFKRDYTTLYGWAKRGRIERRVFYKMPFYRPNLAQFTPEEANQYKIS